MHAGCHAGDGAGETHAVAAPLKWVPAPGARCRGRPDSNVTGTYINRYQHLVPGAGSGQTQYSPALSKQEPATSAAFWCRAGETQRATASSTSAGETQPAPAPSKLAPVTLKSEPAQKVPLPVLGSG